MESHVLDRTLLQVRQLLEHDDVPRALRIIESLLPPDQADLFVELDPETQEALLPQLEVADAADILEELSDEDAADLASRLDMDELAEIVAEMEPDKAADLLGDLSPALTEATLSVLHEEAEDVLPLLLHPDETAGGLMTSEYLVFPEAMTAARALDAVRNWTPKGEQTPYLYVVGEGGRLIGVLNLFGALRAQPGERLGALANRDVLAANVHDGQEEVARLMARYDLTAVPVVDDDYRLVGVIDVDALVDVLEEEATEDVQRFGGSQPLNRPYLEATIPAAASKRIGWLLLLFVTGTLTGAVMRMFQSTLDQVIVLALFIPLLIGTGGNAGSQTTATVMRALAVGDIDLGDSVRVLWLEFRTALVLGLLLSVGGFVTALLYGSSPLVAAVVACAMLGIVIWADTVGSLLPLLAARVGVDPALVSGPLMSTVVDATGLMIYFSIARALLLP
ncbi:MAG: magnesium transporter [Chloroflexi bacterium]|nr:magnesium transporter [Chloroflexota bacterium]